MFHIVRASITHKGYEEFSRMCMYNIGICIIYLHPHTHTHTRISGKRFDEGIYDLTQKNILPIPPPNPKKTPNTKTQWEHNAQKIHKNENEKGKKPHQGVHSALALLQLLLKLFHATHVEGAKRYDLQHP